MARPPLRKWVDLVIVVGVIAGLSAAGWVVTRPDERELDAAGRTWVSEFRAWRDAAAATVESGVVGLDFGTERRNARLIEPLRTCSEELTRIGTPPELLDTVLLYSQFACGEARIAVGLNDRFGESSLASTKQHLQSAGGWLDVALDQLRAQLGSG